MTVREEFRDERAEGFKAYFSSIPASNDTHLKIELYDDDEPQDGHDVQNVECWRHCGHDDLLYFCVTPWKNEGGLVLNSSNAKLLADILLAYAETKWNEDQLKESQNG